MIENVIQGKNVLEVGGPSALLHQLYPKMLTVSFLNLAESMSVHHQGKIRQILKKYMRGMRHTHQLLFKTEFSADLMP